MTNTDNASSTTKREKSRFHDRAITLMLAAIWGLAVLFVLRNGTDIPASMLLIGTVFFVLLVPAMKELVRILDRWLRAELGLSPPLDDDSQGGD